MDVPPLRSLLVSATDSREYWNCIYTGKFDGQPSDARIDISGNTTYAHTRIIVLKFTLDYIYIYICIKSISMMSYWATTLYYGFSQSNILLPPSCHFIIQPQSIKKMRLFDWITILCISEKALLYLSGFWWIFFDEESLIDKYNTQDLQIISGMGFEWIRKNVSKTWCFIVIQQLNG